MGGGIPDGEVKRKGDLMNKDFLKKELLFSLQGGRTTD